ncbi:MAG: GGDEF domain-containing protein [Rubrivivax sp.]|nr:GGDEF domain-containing protein [Rubrivivax sp.]
MLRLLRSAPPAWLLAAALPALALHAPLPDQAKVHALASWQALLDQQVRRGYEEPDQALATLATLQPRVAHLPVVASERRALALARALVAASAGRDGQTAAALDAFAADDALAAADRRLVQAALADAHGDTTLAAEAGRDALQAYRQLCPAHEACDLRSTWRALQLLARHDALRGHPSTALGHALAAAELARHLGDDHRQAWALAMAADLAGELGDAGAEQQHLAQAQRLARLAGTPQTLARVHIYELRLHRRRGDLAGARRVTEQGLDFAEQARSPRLAAVLLANLSDLDVHEGRPRQALAAVERALPVARRAGDRRLERALLHNAAVARIGLGEGEAALKTLDTLLADYRASGVTADEAGVLREFADAFAAAGALRTALALYHRERALAAQMMAANREAALAQLRERHDHEAQQRRLAQLARDNALMGAQIENRAAMQQVWMGGAAALALAVLLVALLYRRVHVANRRLQHNHLLLRERSQRDPLTGLANRRALHERAAAQGLDRRFAGALLLVDIDHFKQVNDRHGHAAGDAVIAEVARRLAGVVRDDDLVVRWGGEEFLVLMPPRAPERAPAAAAELAARVLQAVGGAPLPAGDGAGTPRRTTVSVGFGAFPLPPAGLPLSLQRAVDLVDMALYMAKHQGRNRAVGVIAAAVESTAALHEALADPERARRDGVFTLQQIAGPRAAPDGAGDGADGMPAAALDETVRATAGERAETPAASAAWAATRPMQDLPA